MRARDEWLCSSPRGAVYNKRIRVEAIIGRLLPTSRPLKARRQLRRSVTFRLLKLFLLEVCSPVAEVADRV
jgi:hypothetical protein